MDFSNPPRPRGATPRGAAGISIPSESAASARGNRFGLGAYHSERRIRRVRAGQPQPHADYRISVQNPPRPRGATASDGFLSLFCGESAASARGNPLIPVHPREYVRIRRVRAGQPSMSAANIALFSNPPRPRGATAVAVLFVLYVLESAASARGNPYRRYVSAKAKSGGWKAAAVADFARSRVRRFCIAPRSLVDSELG